ncbi:hypothetical protein JZ785_03680 [Alicyclobacillus curvatus]|nr:hypothetical protein JZ785_03680 [Alicyclobacillus curvatus]
MDIPTRIASKQHAHSQVAAPYRFIPTAAQSASIEKLNFWLQSAHPERTPMFVKILRPAFAHTQPVPLKATTVPLVQYHRNVPVLILDERYRIDRVYVLVNLTTKPFVVQFFIMARDSADRCCLLQLGRRSRFKKDPIPAATRLGLVSK